MDKGVIMQMNMNEVLKTARREWIAAAALSNLTHQDTLVFLKDVFFQHLASNQKWTQGFSQNTKDLARVLHWLQATLLHSNWSVDQIFVFSDWHVATIPNKMFLG